MAGSGSDLGTRTGLTGTLAHPFMAQKKSSTAKKAAPVRTSSKKSATVRASSKKAPSAKKAVKKQSPPKKAAKRAAPKKRALKKVTAKVSAPKPAARKRAAQPVTSKTSTPTKAAKKAAAPTAEPVRRAPSRSEEPAPAPKPAKPVSRYGVGDKVVHPQHGAATIAKRVKREFAGEVRDYYVLDISTESLTVMVPVDKVDSVVRSVISKAQSRNVLNSLKEEPQEAGANWSRWYKVLTEKMYSGDIFQVAEVVRDLSYAQQTKGISPALKRMLSKARMTLISELSFSLEVDEEEATRRLDKAVPKVENPLVPAL